jgi:hypothetical protein
VAAILTIRTTAVGPMSPLCARRPIEAAEGIIRPNCFIVQSQPRQRMNIAAAGNRGVATSRHHHSCRDSSRNLSRRNLDETVIGKRVQQLDQVGPELVRVDVEF